MATEKRIEDEQANRGMPCGEALPHKDEIRIFTILYNQKTKKYRMVQDDLVFSVTIAGGTTKDILKDLTKRFRGR